MLWSESFRRATVAAGVSYAVNLAGKVGGVTLRNAGRATLAGDDTVGGVSEHFDSLVVFAYVVSVTHGWAEVKAFLKNLTM